MPTPTIGTRYHARGVYTVIRARRERGLRLILGDVDLRSGDTIATTHYDDMTKHWRDASWHLDRVFWRLKSKAGYIPSRVTFDGHLTADLRSATTDRLDAFEMPSRSDALDWRTMADPPLKPAEFKLVRVTVWRRKRSA